MNKQATPWEFDIMFYNHLKELNNPQEAFWKTYEWCEKKYGKSRYADYHSYRISKFNRLRRG